MSVPLPSPSPLPTATMATSQGTHVPRSRPQPIATAPSGSSYARSAAHALTSPGSPTSPQSGSFRRGSAVRSAGLGTSAASGEIGSSWRDRVAAGPKSAVRTVGGFDKKPATAPAKDKEADGEQKSAALSHVPCRFFKAGACTAGDACPFSHEEGGKREVCQWFLKGNCRFGHKCALAHVRPGEPMSMDRKNKKASQIEAKDREPREPGREAGSNGERRAPQSTTTTTTSDTVAAPVPIRSALSSSLQSSSVNRIGSSPLRDPIGPPPATSGTGSSPGFTRSPVPPSTFASSPSRPSPLSVSFGARNSLRATHSPLRPPVTAFASSFSHTTIREVRPGTSPAAPLSASFADGSKNIWARSETPLDQPEVLSPRRPIQSLSRPTREDVFEPEEDEDHGEDLIPSSLSDLLTPREFARRMSRRDSSESFSLSPQNAFFRTNGERLAQSASAAVGPGFLHGLWSSNGVDARKEQQTRSNGLATASAIGSQGPSLLAQQRTQGPPLPTNGAVQPPLQSPESGPYFNRPIADPSSPSNRAALQSHAPGQSLPGGLANALSRLHMHGPKTSSGLAYTPDGAGSVTPEAAPKSDDAEHEEGLFAME